MTDYAGRYAYLAKKYAEGGYDFVCMDQRGHGRSEGMPGHFESVDQLVQDTLNFHDKVMESGAADLPRYLLAHSTGCLQALAIAESEEARVNYKGMSLVNPFFGFEDMNEAQRLVSLMKTVTYFMSSANVPNFVPASGHNYFYKHWLEDPLAPKNMPMKSHVALFNVAYKLREYLVYPDENSLDYFKSVSHLPLLMFLGGSDRTSCLVTSRTVFKALPMEDKNVIELEECDHFLLQDGDWVDMITNDIISWQDTH